MIEVMGQESRSTRASTSRPAGSSDATRWLSARGLSPTAPWEVSISLDVVDQPASASFVESDTRFHIVLSPSEWGFYFSHQNRITWIRVVDVPAVHERDDFELLGSVPKLRDLGLLVHSLEDQHEIRFRRTLALVQSTIPMSDDKIRLWVVASI